MKMTMKNELKMKHGVILATAVLLIAGIAFAGAAAADGVITAAEWNEAGLQAAADDGGYYTVGELGESFCGLFQGLHTDENQLNISKDLTLDFGYQTIKLKGSDNVQSSAGGLFGVVSGIYARNLTIKNLTIDGGSVKAIGSKGAYWDGGAGGLIGMVDCYGSKVFTQFYNVRVSNVSVSSEIYNVNVGGLVGNGPGIDRMIIENCSVVNSTIAGKSQYGVGGLVGFLLGAGGNSDNCRVDLCSVENVVISDSSASHLIGVGGIIGYSTNGFYAISNTRIINSVIMGGNNIGAAGGICGLYGGDSIMSSMSNVEVENCLIYNAYTDGASGGVIGSANEGTHSGGDSGSLNCQNVKVKDSTIIGGSFAGGFAGALDFNNNKATLTDNTVSRSCVVAENSDGVAAGFIAKAWVA